VIIFQSRAGCGSSIGHAVLSNILQDTAGRFMVKKGMQPEEWTKPGHHGELDLRFLHAYHVRHAYPRHSHDYYVICLIERGHQSFLHEGTKHVTPPGGVILINPGAVHTGEAADQYGFEMLSLYPTVSQMEMAVFELTGQHKGLPFFKDVRVDDPWVTKNILALHDAVLNTSTPLEFESRFLWTLVGLIRRYADISYTEHKLGREKTVVKQVCDYIEENFARGVSLRELAQYTALSPYYLLRLFRAQVGMPPYAYLENVRVRHAQKRIERGQLLVDVALESGFSSQSHMTRHFKRILGVTPGQYAQQVRD
jgi:AraC-like DNA-binding protein